MSQAKADVKELIVIPQESALTVFTTEGAILPYLEQIKLAVSDQLPITSTKKGRDEIASLAYKVAQSKTYLESVGKKLADEQKEIPKKIDATRRLVKDQLDALRDEVRKPLTDWEFEQARIEQERQELIAKRQSSIEAIYAMTNFAEDATSEDIQDRLVAVCDLVLDAEFYADRLEEAKTARASVMEALADRLVRRQQFESEQAELAELRRKQAERDAQDERDRIAREAAEKAQREADERAQKERDAAAQREADLKLQADNAELERIAAEQRAEQAERDSQARAEQAAEAERQRIAEEQAQAEADARAREQDREHRKAINTAALDALVKEGFTKEQGVQIITLIAQRKIPNISIQY